MNNDYAVQKIDEYIKNIKLKIQLQEHGFDNKILEKSTSNKTNELFKKLNNFGFNNKEIDRLIQNRIFI